jgi:ribosome biogenesis GTPase
MRGRVLRAFSDRCLVAVGGEERICRPRGRLRLEGRRLVTGDLVEVEADQVVHWYPRRNELTRPPVANVDVAFVVVSLAQPPLSLLDLDRQLTHVLRAGIEAVVVANKVDLAGTEALRALRPYEAAGFPVVSTDAVRGEGILELASFLADVTAVLVGGSGVGKSSLARQLAGRPLRVGEVSPGTERGRHTTRWCELLPARGGYLVDTPGFQNLEPEAWDEAEVAVGWPEFQGFRCRFRDCRHDREPGCGVRAAAEQGTIDRGRSARYRTILVAACRRHFPGRVEVHLMTEHPERLFAALQPTGSERVYVHWEAVADLATTVADLHGQGFQAGVAINPATPWQVLEPYLHLLDAVLVMTVQPGEGGQPFQPEPLAKVRALRAAGFRGLVAVDGGIHAGNAGLVVGAGADLLVAGSAGVDGGDARLNLSRLQAAADI